MKVKLTNSVRALAGGLLLGLLTFLFLVQYAPDAVALSTNNYGWNGLQGVASAYKVNFTASLSGLPARSILVVIQPSANFTITQAAAVRGFLDGGGTLLVADKSGVANTLLSRLGSPISIQADRSIVDSTYNWKSKSVPTALVLASAQSKFTFLSGVKGIALSQPAPLLVSGGRVSDIAITSQFSSVQTSSSSTTTRGPFVVMAGERVGNGTLLVVGDSQFLLNSEWNIANNKVLIGNLFSNSSVYVDTSHWGVSSTGQLKAELSVFYSFLSASPIRYLATFLFVGVALLLLPDRDVGRTESSGERDSARITPFNDGHRGLEE